MGGQTDTLWNTHPGQAWAQLVTPALLGCLVISVTRTHDVLKKARTNLEVRKPLGQSVPGPTPEPSLPVIRVCR